MLQNTMAHKKSYALKQLADFKAKIIENQFNGLHLDIDGEDVFNHCGLGLSKCSETHPCPIHDDFKKVRESFREMCERNEIKVLYENVNSGLAYLVG